MVKWEQVLSNTKTAVTNETAVNIAKSTGASTNVNKNSTGLAYSAFGGYGHTFNDAYYIGGEASILGDTTKRSMNQNATDAGSGASYSANVNYKRGLALGLSPIAGYAFGNDKDQMIYVKPGVEVSKDKATAVISLNGSPSQTVSNTKTNIALAPSVGYAKAMGKNLLLRTEYTYNMGKKIGINSYNGAVAELGNVSYTDQRVSVGAAYKF